MKLVHYSGTPIQSFENRPYNQSELSWQAKPNGLWFSVEDIEKLPNNYNWKEWCESENYRVEELKYSYDIVLKENANILHLKTAKEIFDFGNRFPLKTRDWDAEHDTYQLDWDSVKKEYQGIIISPYQWECRLALESYWYYGWDCSSGCIWDISCIEQPSSLVMKISLKELTDMMVRADASC